MPLRGQDLASCCRAARFTLTLQLHAQAWPGATRVSQARFYTFFPPRLSSFMLGHSTEVFTTSLLQSPWAQQFQECSLQSCAHSCSGFCLMTTYSSHPLCCPGPSSLLWPISHAPAQDPSLQNLGRGMPNPSVHSAHLCSRQRPGQGSALNGHALKLS